MTRWGMRLKLLNRWVIRRIPWHEPFTTLLTSRSELWPKVHDLVARQSGLPKPKISPNSHFVNDLGFDSLDSVELVLSLEQEFRLEIPDEDEEKLVTVADLLRYLEERLSYGKRPIGG